MKILPFSNFLELTLPRLLPKESGYVPVMSITYLGLVRIFSTKFHPNPSILRVFQDFRSPPNFSQYHRIRSGFKIRALRHYILPNIKFH